MSRDFTHTITVPTGRTGYPLRATVTATFDNDGSMGRWGLALQDLPQSIKNRDALMHILKGVCRDEISGDGIGVKWETPERLAIWTSRHHWALTPKQAFLFSNESDRVIGRFANEAKPAPAPSPWDAPPPVVGSVAYNNKKALEDRIAALEKENADLKAMVRFLRDASEPTPASEPSTQTLRPIAGAPEGAPLPPFPST
jgi:hypothetical protein